MMAAKPTAQERIEEMRLAIDPLNEYLSVAPATQTRADLERLVASERERRAAFNKG
jgi:hypothetical protein